MKNKKTLPFLTVFSILFVDTIGFMMIFSAFGKLFFHSDYSSLTCAAGTN